MTKKAEDTQQALRTAMLAYTATVTNERNYDVRTGLYKYPHAISAAEIMRLAGIKSRATLSAPYHEEIKAELDRLVATLKSKTGKGNSGSISKKEVAGRKDRLDQLAQTIAALEFKIIALEQENAALKQISAEKIVNLSRR